MEEKTLKINKKQAIKAINEAYYRLKGVFETVHYGGYHQAYYELNKKEEKQHRLFKPDHIKDGLTISEAIKLFYVGQIISALKNEYKPTIKDYLHVRTSIFYSWTLVENYKEEIIKALENIDLDYINSLDYAELMKEEE